MKIINILAKVSNFSFKSAIILSLSGSASKELITSLPKSDTTIPYGCSRELYQIFRF